MSERVPDHYWNKKLSDLAHQRQVAQDMLWWSDYDSRLDETLNAIESTIKEIKPDWQPRKNWYIRKYELLTPSQMDQLYRYLCCRRQTKIRAQ